jgi:hypothetical protein
MTKYKILLMKMTLDDPTNEKAKVNFDLLCGVCVDFIRACYHLPIVAVCP